MNNFEIWDIFCTFVRTETKIMSNTKVKPRKKTTQNARIGKSRKTTDFSEKTKKHHDKLWRLTKSGCI